MRFIALGDSLTQGVGDPRPGRAGFRGELDGWVTHLADAVRRSGEEIDVENLAIAGARLEHVLHEQLPVVAGRRADLVTCFIGVNDLWDANLDLDVFEQRFHELFGALRTIAPAVMTASMHDVFAPFPLKKPLRDKLNANIARMNEIIGDAAERHGLLLLDIAGRSAANPAPVRSVDFLHPNRYGHQLIAAEAIAVLQQHGQLGDVVPPAAEPVGRGLHDVAHVLWVGSYVRRNWKRWRAEMAASKAAAPSNLR